MAWLITIEGGDGSGKSTLLSRIEADFRSRKIPFLTTREPGGTPVGEEIREILLKNGRTMNTMTELLLYEAARAEHVATVIRPALAKGTHVLCDRFTHSSLAYQGAARGIGEETVERMNEVATGGLRPDAVVWLKLSREAAEKRAAGRGEKNRMDSEGAAFHQSVFDAFSRMAARENFIVLDASLPADQVFAQLEKHPRWRALFGDLE